GADISYKGTTSIEIPEGYRFIGSYAFADCSNLTEVNLPNTLNILRDGAFLKCKRLRSIVLPEHIKSFYRGYESKDGGSFAFYGCNALKEAYHRSKRFKYDYEDTRAFPQKTVLKHAEDRRITEIDVIRHNSHK
ncbi:MAG: leucine-rich repeat domain-containing protein, partial [Solobacterium sp.]|nr:leucine-rich repeat domain-containing protein [Solobacterium sp.]